MQKYTFEEIIEKEGRLVYSSVGTSMLPLIRQGRDLIVIEKPNGRLAKYDIPLYKRAGCQYVLHRVVKVLPEGYIICGDNLWAKERVADSQIIGVLTAIVRGGRELPIESPRFKLYSRVWVALYPLRVLYFKARGLGGRIKRKLRKAQDQA